MLQLLKTQSKVHHRSLLKKLWVVDLYLRFLTLCVRIHGCRQMFNFASKSHLMLAQDQTLYK